MKILPLTKGIVNGGVRCKFVVKVSKIRLVSLASDRLRTPTTVYAQTLAARVLKKS